jgi:hypothetical protein
VKFGEALEAAKSGKKIRLPGFAAFFAVAYMPPMKLPVALVNGRTLKSITRQQLTAAGGLDVQGYFVGVNTETGWWAPGYVFSGNDVVRDDWEVLEQEG